MNAIRDTSVADQEKKIDIKFDLNENLGDSMGKGLDAIGKVFGGLIGAIKDAVGPEMMKALETANWLGQVAECLETISKSLSTDGSVPDDSVGQLSFLKAQLDSSLEGSKFEAQKATFQQHLQDCQQALDNSSTNPQVAAKTVAQAAGYFKAAAKSLVPIKASSDSRDE
jgi:hypothetical protein